MNCGGRRWLGMLILATALHAQPALSQDGTELEYRVKAAFLFNFTKFVDWPPDAFANSTSPLRICVLGSDPFGPILDETINGKNVNNHKLAVARVSASANLRDCNVLFISRSEQGQIRDVIAVIRERPVLTVSETADFTDAGGMVRFLLVDGKVRFSVNRRATEAARLTMSSKLLSVAHTVTDSR